MINMLHFTQLSFRTLTDSRSFTVHKCLLTGIQSETVLSALSVRTILTLDLTAACSASSPEVHKEYPDKVSGAVSWFTLLES